MVSLLEFPHLLNIVLIILEEIVFGNVFLVDCGNELVTHI